MISILKTFSLAVCLILMIEQMFLSSCYVCFFHSTLLESEKAKKQSIAHFHSVKNQKRELWLIMFLCFVELGSRGVFTEWTNRFSRVAQKSPSRARFAFRSLARFFERLIFVGVAFEGLSSLSAEREASAFDGVLGGVVFFCSSSLRSAGLMIFDEEKTLFRFR